MRLALIVSLLAQVIGSQNTATPGCRVYAYQVHNGTVLARDAPWQNGSKQVSFYLCETPAQDHPTLVTKPWFKAHCKGDDWRATCDQYAAFGSSVTAAKEAAKPPTHKVENIVLGIVVGVLVTACIASGGCGAMTGGDIQ